MLKGGNKGSRTTIIGPVYTMSQNTHSRVSLANVNDDS